MNKQILTKGEKMKNLAQLVLALTMGILVGCENSEILEPMTDSPAEVALKSPAPCEPCLGEIPFDEEISLGGTDQGDQEILETAGLKGKAKYEIHTVPVDGPYEGDLVFLKFNLKADLEPAGGNDVVTSFNGDSQESIVAPLNGEHIFVTKQYQPATVGVSEEVTDLILSVVYKVERHNVLIEAMWVTDSEME
jgi:hypothetical protein